MAASNVTIEVQEYLDKHKINALFEDMRAKLIKNLPSDPLTYLINVLKAIQERKKRAAPLRGSASSSRVEVEGKAVKPVVTDKLTKSSDNIRPLTSTPKKLPSQSAGVPAVPRSGSKLKAPETPTTPKAGTKETPRTSKYTPRPTRATTATKTSKATTVSSKPSSATRPSTAPSNGQTKTTRNTKPQPSSSASKVTTKSTAPKTSPAKSTPAKSTPAKSTPAKATPTKPSSGTAKRVLKTTAPALPATATTVTTTTTTVTTVKASDETIDEFFGEKKKSSSMQLFVSEQEEMTELEEKDKPVVEQEEMTELEVKDKPVVDEETDVISAEAPSCEDTSLIDAYLEKKKGPNKGTRDDHLKSLQDMILTDQKSGNHDDGEESDEGEDVVGLLEDVRVLQEDEGVDTIKSQDSHTKQVAKKVDVTGDQPMICSRCAR